ALAVARSHLPRLDLVLLHVTLRGLPSRCRRDEDCPAPARTNIILSDAFKTGTVRSSPEHSSPALTRLAPPRVSPPLLSPRVAAPSGRRMTRFKTVIRADSNRVEWVAHSDNFKRWIQAAQASGARLLTR